MDFRCKNVPAKTEEEAFEKVKKMVNAKMSINMKGASKELSESDMKKLEKSFEYFMKSMEIIGTLGEERAFCMNENLDFDRCDQICETCKKHYADQK